MASTWVYQKPADVEAKGQSKASWYVGWYDYDGKKRAKSFGPGYLGKQRAEKHAATLEKQLTEGTYQRTVKKSWQDFREEYESRILAGLSSGSQVQTKSAMNHFETICKPGRLMQIQTNHIDEFISGLRMLPGKKPGSKMSAHTINKILRHLKAVFTIALDWGYIQKMPKFRMEKAVKELPNYVTAEHFTMMYEACNTATFPKNIPNINPAEWWRSLLAVAYMTGWRINEILTLRKDTVDLEAGVAILAGDETKGRRDERVNLNPVVIDHLKLVAGFSPVFFTWNNDKSLLYTEFGRIQRAAGIHLVCRKKHNHTETCHVYGFHDLRRAFATMNADKVTTEQLQALMRHQSYQTTQGYINYAKDMKKAVEGLYTPDVLKKKDA